MVSSSTVDQERRLDWTVVEIDPTHPPNDSKRSKAHKGINPDAYVVERRHAVVWQVTNKTNKQKLKEMSNEKKEPYLIKAAKIREKYNALRIEYEEF